MGGGRGQGRDGGEEVGGAWLQSGVARQPSGVSVAGNISTLACMKERSGRPAITLAASSLRFSSFLGFLSNRKRHRDVHRSRHTRTHTRLPNMISTGGFFLLLHFSCRPAASLSPDLVEVLVFSMVDIKRAKASATRLPELPGSSLAVVSSYSSGSTPD